MIRNSTKNFALVEKEKILTGFFEQGIGFTFQPGPPSHGLVFVMKKKKKVALTMFFVFFPIDVLFLDRDKRVVEIKKNFRPFTNYYPRKEALYIVELPIGLLKNTRLGDRIAITSL